MIRGVFCNGNMYTFDVCIGITQKAYRQAVRTGADVDFLCPLCSAACKSTAETPEAVADVDVMDDDDGMFSLSYSKTKLGFADTQALDVNTLTATGTREATKHASHKKALLIAGCLQLRRPTP